MEEGNVVSAIEPTPIETITNHDSAVLLFNDEIRLKEESGIHPKRKYPITIINGSSTPIEMSYLKQMGEGINESVGNKHKINVRPNQVGMVTPATEVMIEDLNRKDQENFQSTWDSEKAWHEKNALAREKIFESILQNHDTKFSWVNTSFYTFGIMLAGSSITIPYCLFPAHDIVKFPGYWYEILYHGSIFSGLEVAFWTALGGAVLNMRQFKQFKTLSIVCVIGIGSLPLFYTSTYCLWTLVFSFNYPIPFLAYGNSFWNRMICCVAIWVAIPKEWRRRQEMKENMKYFLVWMLAMCVSASFYPIMSGTLRFFRGPFQPLISLAFPASREIGGWLLSELVKYCANGDERAAVIEFLYPFYTSHTICLSYVIGSISDHATSWTLMATDFTLNIYHCIKIVRTQQRSSSAATSLMDLFYDLSIAELAEFQSILSTTLVFALAFYTPVGSLIGNVRNDYWAYEAVDDVNEALTDMTIFFFVEVACMVATCVILQIYCHINYLKIVAELQKEFFGSFILSFAFLTLGVDIKF